MGNGLGKASLEGIIAQLSLERWTLAKTIQGMSQAYHLAMEMSRNADDLLHLACLFQWDVSPHGRDLACLTHFFIPIPSSVSATGVVQQSDVKE